MGLLGRDWGFCSRGGKQGALDQGDILQQHWAFCSVVWRHWEHSIASSRRWPQPLRHSQILSHRRPSELVKGGCRCEPLETVLVFLNLRLSVTPLTPLDVE